MNQHTTGVRRRVLVVDDDALVRRLTAALLSGAGLDVAAVADGDAAMQRLLQEKFDLVLSDATMPGMDGLELVAGMRARGDSTPFILMSGYAAETAQLQALGASAYLPKPFSGATLLASVEAALPASPSQAPPHSYTKPIVKAQALTDGSSAAAALPFKTAAR